MAFSDEWSNPDYRSEVPAVYVMDATVRSDRECARQVMAFMNNQPSPYTTGFRFTVPMGGTADADREMSP
jgi:hypothetical protein